jgi:hypothetical protein
MTIHGGSDRREYILSWITDDVFRDFRHAGFIESSLGSQVSGYLILIKQKYFGDELQGAHRDKVFSCGLDSLKSREDVRKRIRHLV